MSYNDIDLTKYNFDTEFIEFIESYQNIYKSKVLNNTLDSLEVKNVKRHKKRDIKKILEEFFFTPKYNNVLDVLKF